MNNEHLPTKWQYLYEKMIFLIDQLDKDNANEKQNDLINLEDDNINVKLSETMPLSCSSSHLHKFDDLELSSEPKVIYLNQNYYK